MKTKITAGSLPHDEVITVPQDYTQRRLNIEEIEKAYPEAYKWAREFHNLYEETAPMFGYETRKETKEFDPKSSNGRLMAYVCFNIIHQALAEERKRVMGEINERLNKLQTFSGIGDIGTNLLHLCVRGSDIQAILSSLSPKSEKAGEVKNKE